MPTLAHRFRRCVAPTATVALVLGLVAPAAAKVEVDDAGLLVSPPPAGLSPTSVMPSPSPPGPRAEAFDADALWAAYEARWTSTTDYQAAFGQTIEVAGIGSEVHSAGRFYYAAPDKVLWEYLEGPPQTVIGDGRWIWIHQPDLEQVYRIDYETTFGSGGLMALLTGEEGLATRYRTRIEPADDGYVRISLSSFEAGGEALEVLLTRAEFDLHRVRLTDAAGTVTRIEFTEPGRNVGIDPARFTFTPSPGVDIITDSGQVP